MDSASRAFVSATAVLTIGFCLGVASHVQLPLEALVALIGAATALLLIASFRKE